MNIFDNLELAQTPQELLLPLIVSALIVEGVKRILNANNVDVNSYIPFVAMLIGAILVVILYGLTSANVLTGIVVGWASSGLYDTLQAFKINFFDITN